jgi:hypothetical protein
MNEQLMTIEEFNKYPIGLIIRSGLISNSPTGVFMTNDDKLPLLRYVIIKRVEGWVMYLGRVNQTIFEIAHNGDKSNTEEYIRRCFPCTDEVFKLYRS